MIVAGPRIEGWVISLSKQRFIMENSDNRQCKQCRQAPLRIHNIFQTCRGFLERAKNKCRNAAIHTHTHIYIIVQKITGGPASSVNTDDSWKQLANTQLDSPSSHGSSTFRALPEFSQSISHNHQGSWLPVMTRPEDFQAFWSPSPTVFAQFHPTDLPRIIALLKITHAEQLVGPETSRM